MARGEGSSRRSGRLGISTLAQTENEKDGREHPAFCSQHVQISLSIARAKTEGFDLIGSDLMPRLGSSDRHVTDHAVSPRLGVEAAADYGSQADYGTTTVMYGREYSVRYERIPSVLGQYNIYPVRTRSV